MCVNQKCMSVESLRLSGKVSSCPDKCNGHGVCNNMGHCHCDEGFSPPLCNTPGVGGSEDSGPASDPNSKNFKQKICEEISKAFFNFRWPRFREVYVHFLPRNRTDLCNYCLIYLLLAFQSSAGQRKRIGHVCTKKV